jgi:hypothetical protein
VRVDPADPGAALETAAFWGARHAAADEPLCVVVCRVPRSVVERLESSGLLQHTDVPVQSVFHPGAFPILNQEASWFPPIPVGR